MSYFKYSLSHQGNPKRHSGGVHDERETKQNMAAKAGFDSPVPDTYGYQCSMPSAGSVFKRPAVGFSGKYIEDAGLKGFKIGGAQVSEKHAGFIVNAGGATSGDVLALIEKVKKVVSEKFGVMLETEIIYVE